MYFRRINIISTGDFYGKIVNTEPLTNNNEIIFYWKVLEKIIEINPLLLKQNIDLYFSWFSLGKIENLLKIYTLLLKYENFNNKQHIGQIMSNLILKRKKLFKLQNQEHTILQIEEKYLFVEPNLFYKQIKKCLSNKQRFKEDFEKIKLLWNLNYYSQNLDVIANIPISLIFYIACIILRNEFKTNEDKLFFDKFFLNISVVPIYKPEIIDGLSKSYLQSGGNINHSNIITFLEKRKLYFVKDFKLKILTEFLILYVDINNEPKKYFKSFVKNNIQLINVKNTDDKDLYLIFNKLYVFTKKKYKKDPQIFYELLKTFFESSEMIFQFTDFQKVVIRRYLLTLLQLENFELLVPLIINISNFIFEEKNFMDVYVEIISKLKEKKNYSYKQIKAHLVDIYKTSKETKNKVLSNCIIYFFMYHKITKTKSQIEKLNIMQQIYKIDKHMDIHLIFLFLNKNIRKKLRVQKNENKLSQLYKSFEEGKMSINLSEIFDDKEFSHNFLHTLENELNYLYQLLNEHYILVNNIEIINETQQITLLFPREKQSEDFAPHIIYCQYVNNFTKITQTFKHSNQAYKLKGIVVQTDNPKKKIILIKNEYNSYWYSIHDRIWIHSFEDYLQEKLINKIYAVYYLDDKEQSNLHLSYSQLSFSSEKTSYFTKYYLKEMRWLLINAINDLVTNSDTFVSIFKLQDVTRQTRLLQIPDIPWNLPKYQKFLDSTKNLAYFSYLTLAQLED